MVDKFDFLIAGLGNPGSKYELTRHNIGWMVVDEFAKRHKVEWNIITSIYYGAHFKFANKNVFICKPTTYMNNSGEAIRKISAKYFIKSNNIIAIMDEYNFDVGKIHVRKTGGSGGHNGTSSIIQELETNEFIKLRCGIGKNFHPGGMVEYVLQNFTEKDYENLKIMINNSCDALESIIKIGFSHSSSLINSGKLWKKDGNKSNDIEDKSKKKHLTQIEQDAKI